MGTILGQLTDPSQLQTAVQFADVYDKLNVTSQQLTASLAGNVNAIGPFSQALTTINSTFSQLTSQAQQFGVSVAPITAALDAVTATLNQDFKINLAEALSTAIDGGNDFISKLIQIHQAFVQNTNDAQALATGVPTGTTPGFAGGTMGSSSGTPSGWILVGEQGPEWMLQPGGATVLPHGQQPADVPDPLGRSFADGTSTDLGAANNVATLGSAASGAANGPTLPGLVDIANAIAPDATSAATSATIAGSTLGTIASGVGIGSAAGSLLNLALGGNATNASIGSTAGSIAGTLVGSLLGGPLIGGLIGGLLGGLGGLFGPKPSNNASGDEVDLASGTIQGFRTAGDSNADQVVAQISAGISAISTTFQKATGGSISGAVSVQDGKRDGIKTSYAGPLGNIDAKWGSVEDAISQFALAIAHDLVGIAQPLQAALDATNDPNALIPIIEQFTGASIDLNSGTVTFPPPTSAPAAGSGAGITIATAASIVAPPPPPPPTLQQMYNSVVGSNPTDFNNTTGLQNKAALVGLLTSYGALSATLQQSYDAVVGSDPADFNNTISGLQNKTSLISLLTAYAALSADEQAKYDATIATDPGTWNNTPAGIQNKLNLVAFEAGGTPGAPAPAAAAPTIDSIVAQYNALPAYAAGTTATPPGWILVGEQGPEWLYHPQGGATVLPNGVQPPNVVSPVGRSFADGTAADITSAIAGTEAAQAGPVLATLGLDQLQVVIQNLATAAPEIAQMAQNLVNSGNALPDILTQGIQALTDPLDIAIEKEKAAGQERVDIATQTGQDLVEVEQLNSANLVQAVVSNLGSQTALNAILYPGNTKALETLQAAPTLAGLSGQQLAALVADIGNVAPDLAALAQQFITTGTALPDTITQALEGIVNPLELAIQQQAAQSEARSQVQQATGQNAAEVAALNSASVIQAIVQQISNPAALQALTAHGSPQGLAALQAGPAIAGLGLDQLQALATAIGSAAPQLTNMINALIASGNALPDALSQATEAITESGLLAVQKAQALAFEQIQTAGVAGQNVGEAQQLGAAEVAQATAQATGTQIPLGPLPDWVGQLEEAVTAPLQLAIQKEQAAGIQRVQIATATGANLVAVQQENADAIAQIWYQATQQLTSLKNDITTGTLSGLTAANQVTASIEQFNQILALVQSGNTNFINDLSTAGQAAVQASQQAYGQGPQTASVREQVLAAISPFLVSASGYPTSSATAVLGETGSTASATATGTTSDLQDNTTALVNLTDALTAVGTGASAAGSSATGAAGPLSDPAEIAAAAAAASPGFSPDLTASLDNLTAQYNSLSPAMQAIYNGVVGSDNGTFNNAAGLGNKVDLAALLAGYQGLSPTASAQYDATVSGNPATYNNTASGISNKLNLVESLYPSAQAPATATSATAGTPAATPNLTTNPVTGQSFTGSSSGITAVTPNFPLYPSASTLSNALADAIAGRATAADWATINQALQAGILNPTEQPGYALVIEQAQQWAAGQAIDPSLGLAQALSDAVNGTPTLQEWALINQAVNAGILSPTAQPQYATIIQRARNIANAQATSLSSIPNPQTAYSTVIGGVPAFAAGTSLYNGTPAGPILVGERGPEWYRSANDNRWTEIGTQGPEIIQQAGGATIIPFPATPPGMPSFADGTAAWQGAQYSWTGGQSGNPFGDALDKMKGAVVLELQALRKQLLAGQADQSQDNKTANRHLGEINKNIGPNISAPVRRAVG